MSALPTSASTARARAAVQERPALAVVGRPSRRRSIAVLVAITVVAGVSIVLSLSALAAESAFAARELEREIDSLSLAYEELTAEVAGLESPDRVRRVALEELGMVEAEHPAYLVVERPLGDAAPPTGAASGLADPVKQALGAGS
jgi:cell division protein FtsB